MPLAPPTDLMMRNAVAELARALDAAPAGERGALVAEFAERHAMSVQTVYRRMRAVGWRSGRRVRRDAGASRQDDAALVEMAAAARAGVRRNGKATMHTPTARSVLAVNGREFAVSNARLNTLRRVRRLDLGTLGAPAPHVGLRSLHPNHVHVVDPSLALTWFVPGGGQRWISDAEAYKNKPETIERIGARRCWRYVLVDHYSGALTLRYYQGAGESTANLFDFLLHAWGQQPGRLTHGVPSLLLMDKGSANTAGATLNALRALGVQVLTHAAGNPRAKGGVEQANNLVEIQFESRLKLEPVGSIEALNEAATAWQHAFNANAVPGHDTRIHRRGLAQPMERWALWSKVRATHLRELPPLDVCRHLLTRDPVERVVRADLTVTFAHPAAKRSLVYDLREIADVCPRDTVRVSPLVYGEHEIVVYTTCRVTGEERTHVATPVEFDEAGFRADAPVIGEAFARHADTAADTAAKAADRAAYPGADEAGIKRARERNEAPFGGLDAHSHLANVVPPAAYLRRQGSEIDVPRIAQAEERPLSHVAALRQVARELGRALAPDEAGLVRSLHPDGVPESALPDLVARLRGDVTTTPAASGLRVVK